MSAELSCQELVELVTEYLEDALDEDTRARFDAHLAECDGCRTYLEQFRRTIELTGRLSKETLEPEARDVLLAHFRTWKAEGQPTGS